MPDATPRTTPMCPDCGLVPLQTMTNPFTLLLPDERPYIWFCDNPACMWEQLAAVTL